MSQSTDERAAAAPAASGSVKRSGVRRTAERVGALAPGVVLVAYLVYAVRAGLPASSAARALTAVAVTQVLPGALVWRSIRPVRGWWLEDLAMGFAFGTALAVAAQVVAGLTDVHGLSALPLALGALLMALPRSRARILAAQTHRLPWWFGPSVGATALFAAPRLQSYYATVPLTWGTGFRTPHVDTYLHLALSAELLHRGPVRFPWVQSEPLGYHWFSHAWIAQVSASSGAALDEVLVRFMPALLPVVAVTAVAVAAVRLSGRAWAGPVAALLAMAGGNANVLGKLVTGSPLAPLSPSLGLALPPLLALVLLLALRWRGEVRRGGGPLAALVLVAFASAGTKGSTLPLVVAGLGVAAAALLVLDRKALRAVLLDGVVVVACLGVALVLVFRGSGAGLALDPGAAADQTPAAGWLGGADGLGLGLLAVALTLVGILSRGAALLALMTRGRSRTDPVTYLLLGAGLAAAGATAVFSHPGRSQYYFALTGQPLLAIGSALGLVVVVERLGGRRAAAVLGGGALLGAALALAPPTVVGRLPAAGDAGAVGEMLAVAAVLVVLAAVVGWLVSGRRWRPVAAGLAVAVMAAGATNVLDEVRRFEPTPTIGPVAADRPLAVSRDQVAAARWIRDNSDADDLVMTNRHCVGTKEPVRCDSRRFVVAAFSERQVLLEGWTATPMSAKLGPKGRDSITVDYWKPELLALNDRFIAAPDEVGRRELQAIGVRWVFADATRPRAQTLEPFARLRFSNAGVDVYELARR